MNDSLERRLLLLFTFIASFSFFIKSLITNTDIPNGWALFLGAAWGALLGVQEFNNRFFAEQKNKNKENKKDNLS